MIKCFGEAPHAFTFAETKDGICLMFCSQCGQSFFLTHVKDEHTGNIISDPYWLEMRRLFHAEDLNPVMEI